MTDETTVPPRKQGIAAWFDGPQQWVAWLTLAGLIVTPVGVAAISVISLRSDVARLKADLDDMGKRLDKIATPASAKNEMCIATARTYTTEITSALPRAGSEAKLEKLMNQLGCYELGIPISSLGSAM